MLRAAAPAGAAILRPDHVVVLVEEERFDNAIGDTAHLPYVNQLAASSLIFSSVQGLNTPSQLGEMNYLGLYSGSTQGVTDNGRGYTFSGNNIAKAMNNTPGMSFAGYAESLPSDGSQVQQASDPITDPANHPDLYVRNYNPMAMFTSVGTGKVNADVNKTFGHFPSDYTTLPAVSFVIPNTLHNTHGSNESPPFATDPSAYDGLRVAADTWLQQNIDPYVQWAKTHNSLLIITTDELDRQHAGTGVTTMITGDPRLFVPGTNLSPYNHYNTLRTIEDMYGLTPLGSSATVSAFTTNAAGQLVAASSNKHWDGTSNAYLTSHWLDPANVGPYAISAGDTLTITAGTASFSPASTGQFLLLSSTSTGGQELDVTGGTLSVTTGGPVGAGYGVQLNTGGLLKVTAGTVSIAGPLAIGQTAANAASATFSGGAIVVGATAGTDQTLYVGNAGTGSVVQNGSATVTAPKVALAATVGSTGSYSLQSGTLNAAALTVNTGGTFAWTGGTLATTAITQNGGSFSATPTLVIAATGGNAASDVLHGGTLSAGAITVNGGGNVAIDSTGNLTATGLTLGATGTTAAVTQSGGSATVTSLVVGSISGAAGSYTLSGGSLASTTTVVGDGGTGAFNQPGGTHAVSTSLTLGKQAGSAGTYTLSGGVLATPSVSGQSGNSTFNFNGGTLRATAGSDSFLSGVKSVIVQSGGATIDTNSNDITITNPIVAGPSSTGGLTKVGTDDLTLGGANTYTGPTAINAGALTLLPGASLASAAITVAAGATFSVAGALATTATVNANGIVNFAGNTPGGSTGVTFSTLNLAANQ
ncbi:MAG TPA: alkaline phosphatase family protein, partial [Tepidisphaeraceae bacterium]|nr:alkaline phosphatase family protein [Tepidisphaeraceae bacterium]